MEFFDDDLAQFAENGARPLPPTDDAGFVQSDGAKIWYASYGSGAPVILLHGGLGHGGNWGHQVPALVEHGFRAIVVDSRGHGRSTRDERPYTYELMADDLRNVMDTLGIERACLVGWSDGACIALVLAAQHPARVAGVYFFACNMDPSGTKQITEFGLPLQRCYVRHVKDYSSLSATPDQFESFSAAVEQMQKTDPNFTADDLSRIAVPVAVVLGEHDEFIKREHAEYMSHSLPDAEFIELPGVSHFAPLQRPALFNESILAFARRVSKS